MKKLVFAAVCATLAAQLYAIQGTISTETDSKTGEIRWQGRTKSYTVSYKKGKTEVNAEYKLDEVTQIDIAKPAGYDKAVEQVQGGQGAAAIPILAKIVADYKMLVWDKPAGRYLAEAHLAAGNAQKALDVAKDIIDADKKAAYTGDFAPAYWQALLKTGKTDELEKLLKKAATSGSRASAAAALTVRGDMVLAGGDTPENHRKALGDAYLRVVLMFADEECRIERAVAMRKAADSFEKLGMAGRAEGLRAQAKQL